MGKRHGISANGVGSFKETDMYDFSELKPTGKEMAVAILVATALLVAVFGIGYMLGLRNAGAGVSDNGVRIDNVRNELSTAEERQREITSGLESAVQRSDTAEERAVRIEERAVRSESVVRDSGVLIDECQQIIGRVRNRGQKGTPAN